MNDLTTFLAKAGLADLADIFTREDVDLDILGDLTEDELRDLGLSLGQRKRLARALATRVDAATPRDASAPPVADIGGTAGAGRDAGAERRRVTTLFVDLVGSTSLSRLHDVEDFHDIIRAFQTACTEAVERHGGMVAKYMGDGILVYFGYPRAEEGTARRAMRAALEMVDAVAGLRPLPGARLSVRIGAATGLAVVGEQIGSGPSAERQIVGETPNLAARLQAVAAPNTIIVAQETRAAIADEFEMEPQPPRVLAGFPDPVSSFRVLREIDRGGSIGLRMRRGGLARLHGRAEVLAWLQTLWVEATSGRGAGVQIVAGPGLGKSRLLAELQDRAIGTPRAVLSIACDSGFGGTTLHPLLGFLRRRSGIDRGDAPAEAFSKLSAMLEQAGMEEAALPRLAALLGLPAADLYSPPAEAAPQQYKAFSGLLRDLLLGLNSGLPLLLFVEDLHWADSTTREVFLDLATAVADAPILVVGTTRPEGAFGNAEALRRIDVAPLARSEIESLVTDVCDGMHLPTDIMAAIVARANGIPLYAEEITRALLDSGRLEPSGMRLIPRGAVQEVGVPSSLHDTLMARLDALPSARDTAQIAAVCGSGFDAETVAHLAGRDTAEVAEALSTLSASGLLYRQPHASGDLYHFSHALMRDAAYESLLMRRRAELHRAMAERLEADENATPPEVLAFHLSRAGLHARAVEFGLQAGMEALARSANAEAIRHAEACLSWLEHVEEGGARLQSELAVHSILTPALMASRGFAADEVKGAAARALALLDELGDRPEAFPNLHGLTIFHHVRGDRDEARDLARRLITLAEHWQDRDRAVIGFGLLGHALWIDGDLEGAQAALEEVDRIYDVDRHGGIAVQTGIDPLGYALSGLAHVAWMRGQEDAAIAYADRAVAHTAELGHANSHSIAMVFRANIHAERGDRETAARLGAETVAFCDRMGIASTAAYASIVTNWARGDLEASQPVFELNDALGVHVGMTFYRSLAVETAIETGDLATARKLQARSRAQSEAGERFWDPVLHLLDARLIEAEGGSAEERRSALERALARAEAMDARVFEAVALIELDRAEPAATTPARRARLADLLDTHGVRLPLWVERLAPASTVRVDAGAC